MHALGLIERRVGQLQHWLIGWLQGREVMEHEEDKSVTCVVLSWHGLLCHLCNKCCVLMRCWSGRRTMPIGIKQVMVTCIVIKRPRITFCLVRRL